MTFFQQLLLAFLEPIPFSLSLTFGRTKLELQRNFIQPSLVTPETKPRKVKQNKSQIFASLQSFFHYLIFAILISIPFKPKLSGGIVLVHKEQKLNFLQADEQAVGLQGGIKAQV